MTAAHHAMIDQDIAVARAFLLLSCHVLFLVSACC